MPDEYPPEFDDPEFCLVCGNSIYNSETLCDCPDCGVCGEDGNPECYALGHLQPMHDSVQSFCNHIGMSSIAAALRAIDKHNTEHVWIVLNDGTKLYYHNQDRLKELAPYTRLKSVGVGGIAWDGSDWEWGEEGPAGEGWMVLDDLRRGFDEALLEHTALVQLDNQNEDEGQESNEETS